MDPHTYNLTNNKAVDSGLLGMVSTLTSTSIKKFGIYGTLLAHKSLLNESNLIKFSSRR